MLLREQYNKLMKYKNHHRKIEDVVEELKYELSDIKEESLLLHTLRLVLELEDRSISPLYIHLRSPLRQTMYLIDLYYSIEKKTENYEIDFIRWHRISSLLDEIEMIYFVMIGFSEGNIKEDEVNDDIRNISLFTFIDYFANTELRYDEQTLDRILIYFKPYSDFIKSYFDFTIEEALEFIFGIRKLDNNKLNNAIKTYLNDVKEGNFSEVQFIKIKRQAENLIHNKEELNNITIKPDSLKRLIKFFEYDKGIFKSKTIYYAEKRYSELYPLIEFNDKYLCHFNKYLLEAFYNRVDKVLMEDEPTGKYKQYKDSAFENKVAMIFRKFFSGSAKIFTNYSVDGVSENDLLILYGGTCIIVEIKNCKFREPFRNPVKAYDRIKRDFNNAIKLGYEQCKRVEDAILNNTDNEVRILDAENIQNVLYNLKKEKIKDVWSIIVTDYRYGPIQTDLGMLLKKDSDDYYPWSVCVDDLEIFLLLMKKVYKGVSSARFIEFLDYRERMHEHILCGDEIEICGWYLNDREQFKKCADAVEVITTTPEMGRIFDAYYTIGIGFKDEINIDIKRTYQLPKYPKKFDLNIITNEMIL